MNSKQALDILKKIDPINRMNLLTVIPLSGFHCTFIPSIFCQDFHRIQQLWTISASHNHLEKWI
jgi:hypothetical protein